MTPENKSERIKLLTTIGQEVKEELLRKHLAENADEREIVFREDRIASLVDEYGEYLERYRERHIGQDKRVAGDKIAAFTGTLIMRHWLFESETSQVNTKHAAIANETFAIRVCQLFTGKSRFGFSPTQFKQLVHCFSSSFDCDDCMQTWAVATMTHFLEDRNVHEAEFSD